MLMCYVSINPVHLTTVGPQHRQEMTNLTFLSNWSSLFLEHLKAEVTLGAGVATCLDSSASVTIPCN